MLRSIVGVRGLLLVIMAILGLFFGSCSSPQPTSNLSPVSTSISSPIVTPAIQQIPTAQPGLGGVAGRLVAGASTGPAYIGGDVFLGRLIPGSDPKAQPMVAFSNESDPQARVNSSNGSFMFVNVQPGTYALVIWNPTNSFVVEGSNGNPIEVTITGDKVTNLGTIIIP